jgi:hypothetical protein
MDPVHRLWYRKETFEKHPLSPDFGVRLSRHGGINPQNTPCISRMAGLKFSPFLNSDEIRAFFKGLEKGYARTAKNKGIGGHA